MIKLVLKDDLPTLNKYTQAERSGAYVGANMKKKATQYVKREVQKQLPDFTWTKKYDIKICWYRPNMRTDKDNIAFGVKFILDGFQEAGALDNDNWQRVGDIYHYFFVDKEDPRVLVLLTEV